jgi:hypothetical protein
MDVAHLIFLAGAATSPCHVALHFGRVPGQKCHGIQVAPKVEVVEVSLLRFLERLPGVQTRGDQLRGRLLTLPSGRTLINGDTG